MCVTCAHAYVHEERDVYIFPSARDNGNKEIRIKCSLLEFPSCLFPFGSNVESVNEVEKKTRGVFSAIAFSFDLL